MYVTDLRYKTVQSRAVVTYIRDNNIPLIGAEWNVSNYSVDDVWLELYVHLLIAVNLV